MFECFHNNNLLGFMFAEKERVNLRSSSLYVSMCVCVCMCECVSVYLCVSLCVAFYVSVCLSYQSLSLINCTCFTHLVSTCTFMF